MLEELHVRDLAIIEDVWLELGSGLNVLTGETGAGKTVLIEALKLLLGDRADSTMVRAGAEETLVEGRFLIEGEERLVRRRVSSEGRSKCTVDDQMETVGGLSQLLESVVDMHGQHEHQALLSPSRHVGYLDRFIGGPADEALDAYRKAYGDVAAARAHLLELEEVLADRDRRADYMRFVVEEIDSMAPSVGEDDEIESRLPRLRHGERLTEASSTAYAAIHAEGGAGDALADGIAALRVAGGLDPTLDALRERAESLAAEVDDLVSELRAYGESVDHDPAALNEAEARLAALATLKRKYGPALVDVLAMRDESASVLGMLDEGEQGLSEARAHVEQSEALLQTAGAALADVRHEAAPRFERMLAEAAAELALPKAAFEVRLEPLPAGSWTQDGPHRVEFLFSPNVGEPVRPLARIASGGELSRVMLALKGVLGSADDVPVLVFDEVDAGIGGVTALAVGRRLADLAERHQVLVVTHLAQVAAFADRQIVVSKSESGGRTVTLAREVVGDERVAEIARMLSGGDTEAGLAHARELLSSATGGS